jgi:hypothetical protein
MPYEKGLEVVQKDRGPSSATEMAQFALRWILFDAISVVIKPEPGRKQSTTLARPICRLFARDDGEASRDLRDRRKPTFISVGRPCGATSRAEGRCSQIPAAKSRGLRKFDNVVKAKTAGAKSGERADLTHVGSRRVRDDQRRRWPMWRVTLACRP